MMFRIPDSGKRNALQDSDERGTEGHEREEEDEYVEEEAPGTGGLKTEEETCDAEFYEAD
jgi:hypothetical protein